MCVLTSVDMIAKGFVVVMCCLGAAETVKMSDFISPCSYKNPQLDDCATIQGRALLPPMLAGIDQWGVPVLNPLYLPEIIFNKTGGPFLSLFINITNTTHNGWRDIKFRHIKFDTQNLTLDADWTIDNYDGSGYYDAVGSILQVPVSGKGFGTIKTSGVYQTLHVEYKREERNGTKHLKPVHMTTDIKVKYIHYNIKNLFGNEALSNIMNTFLNANSLQVYREVKPFIDEITRDITFKIMSDSFANIPSHEMFKDFDGW